MDPPLLIQEGSYFFRCIFLFLIFLKVAFVSNEAVWHFSLVSLRGVFRTVKSKASKGK